MLAHRIRYHCNYAMGKYKYKYKCVCVRACVCARVCVCMRVWLYGAVVCAVDFQSNIADSIPAEYGFTRLSSPSLSLGGYQQPNCVCLSMHGGQKKKKNGKKEKKELSLAKNSHWELCGARPGSSTVVVQFWLEHYVSA